MRTPRLLATIVASASLAAGGCATAPSGGPARIWLGQTAQGAPVVPVALASWKDRKFDGLVRQETDFSCGAAVLATLFNHAFGYNTTERQVLVNMLKIADPDVVRDKGFSLLDMKNYVRSIDMAGEGYEVDYATLAKLDIPSIALLDIRGYKHFVVVRKVFGDRVAIGDPALGNRTMTREEFEAAWNDVIFVVSGDTYDPATILLDPPDPLSARRLLAQTASIPAAETTEFGFGPGNVLSF